MSDIKLFSINGQLAQELEAKTAVLEKDLQKHVEQHMVAAKHLHQIAKTKPNPND